MNQDFDKIGPWTDLYSLGASLYNLLTNTMPARPLDIDDDRSADKHFALPFPLDVSERTRSLVLALMSTDRFSRPQSVDDVWKMLGSGNEANMDDENGVLSEGSKDKTTRNDSEKTTANEKTVVINERAKVEGKAKPHRKTGGKSHVKTVLGLLFLAAIILAGIFLYYNSKDKSQNIINPTIVEPTDSIEDETDSMVITRFVKEAPSKYEGNNRIEYDYPLSGNEALLQNVREWINEELGGSYEGNLNDADAMFTHYTSNLGDGQGEEETQITYSIKKICENDKIVTFMSDAYVFGGGIHGFGHELGTTFRKTDGKIFNNDMIQNFYEIQPYVKNGLKKYFEVATDEELMGYLQIDDALYNVNNLPKPQKNPWITDKEVVFRYGEYEIAAYASGQPFFSIPISEIKNYLTPTGKTFFE